ncbi:MAG: hypothetical protein DMF89_10880 [Acidobacteria bacterium]|nr:MAG: hypothetical protein DMF89_10880 [Acidobacteriota bacterium]
MDWKELPWDVRVWLGTIFGIIVVVVVAVALIGDWLSGWWTTNLLRNRLSGEAPAASRGPAQRWTVNFAPGSRPRRSGRPR